MSETMCGFAAWKAWIAGLVSCRLPATSRMFRVTGALGVSATVGAAVSWAAALLGAPRAASAGSAAAPTAIVLIRVLRLISLGDGAAGEAGAWVGGLGMKLTLSRGVRIGRIASRPDLGVR